MSERFKCITNENQSKNTRLPVAEDFANYRFNRDELAHVSRYLYVVEFLIAESKRLKKPLKVLDIGCGDIYIARTLQSSFIVKKTDIIYEYVGLDIDETSLQRTQETKPKSFEIRLIQGDITLNTWEQFNDKEFDIVICLETIEHIQPQFVLPLLKQIKRIGRKSIISTPNFDGGTGRIPEDHVKEWGYDELRETIERSGLIILNEFGVFSNINKVKNISKYNQNINKLYSFLENKLDSNFLSIVMARFIGKDSQNIMRICR